MSIKKLYNPKDVEKFLYDFWESNGFLKYTDNKNKEYFCIVMPPPNITGNLHMGHAFQQTIMDILIRYNKMKGNNTLWQVGTDHAGIATQMIVERKTLLEENKTRDSYTRKNFVKKIWSWKHTIHNVITNQIRRMGSCVDWDREVFTLDDNISKSVQKAFVTLYRKNLIYRKKTLVNWDSKLKTVISDIEIEYRVKKGRFWHIRYYFLEKNRMKYIVVATTRPETIFADTAVAVNPNDIRYNKLIGKQLVIPLANRIIKIIADESVDMRKGTGCVKITPAHSFNDYIIGIKHKLLMINIFTKDGNMCKNPDIYNTSGKKIELQTVLIPSCLHNVNRFEARSKIVMYLNKLGVIEVELKHEMSIPYGDRSNEIIEPRLTSQWFLKVKTLSSVAIKAVEKKHIKIIPEKYEKTYFNWMKNIKDWCISRQLWWGHRIPIWFDSQGKMYSGKNETDVRKEFSISDNIVLKQDPDVLDTWFSSALWICTSLGWPKQKDFFKKFYPTSVLVSGFDIIFFWIARMIMLSMYFVKDSQGKPQIPFKKVYITGLIKDELGQKMSKSKGNVIDPIDIIEGISLSNLLKKRTSNMMQVQLKNTIIEQTTKQFPNGIKPSGTDALRFTFASLATPARDIYWNMNRLKSYKHFCNKIWNSGRFVIIILEKNNISNDICLNKISFPNKWILIELNNIIKIYRQALDDYRFDIASNIIFHFIKDVFCDWYLEIVKILINNTDKIQSDETKTVLITVFKIILRLSHPIIPFITEDIWMKINYLQKKKCNSIMLESFPQYKEKYINNESKIINDMLWLQKMIIGLRNIRSEFKIPITSKIPLLFVNINSYNKSIIQKYKFYLKKLTKFNYIEILHTKKTDLSGIVRLVNNVEILILIDEHISKEMELKKLNKSLDKLKKIINKIQLKLSNQNFLTRAPHNVVLLEKNRLLNYQNTFNLLFQKKQKIVS